MDLYNDLAPINSTLIIDIVRRSLSKIDPRLVDHGERVGYIAKMVYSECKNGSDFDFSKLFVLCLLHDIGAYKTNEIDDMVQFELEKPYDHSLFGYLFLKNTAHLAEYAEAILYHHTDYCAQELRNCRYAGYAEIIHLADRADILINSARPNLSVLKGLAGTKFNPDYVDALFRAEARYGITQKIISGGYKAEVIETVNTLEISNREVMDYLKLLVYAIDFRSPYTVTHTADTTLISLELGQLFKFSESELIPLYTGAFLHDIGKIAIPHEILEKPARLTDEEFIIVKRHIPEGEEILHGVISDDICNIALRHHERMDGNGYSHGLTANELTLPQRVVAVADVMSALSQRRSYKEPFDRATVIHILTDMKNSGHLCPTVVDMACNNYDFILNNTARSHNPIKKIYENLTHEYEQQHARLTAR